jgi:hypothetical protein
MVFHFRPSCRCGADVRVRNNQDQPHQFRSPPWQLVQPVGNQTLEGLLWASIGARWGMNISAAGAVGEYFCTRNDILEH